MPEVPWSDNDLIDCVCATREYLTLEYKEKYGEEKKFTPENMPGSAPCVQQQPNFTDCGIFLLQFVESFFRLVKLFKSEAFL